LGQNIGDLTGKKKKGKGKREKVGSVVIPGGGGGMGRGEGGRNFLYGKGNDVVREGVKLGKSFKRREEKEEGNTFAFKATKKTGLHSEAS